MFLPVNDKQFEFWRLKRGGLPNINIARQFNISKQAVSRALITMEERIENTLLEKTDDPTKLAEELFEKLRGMA